MPAGTRYDLDLFALGRLQIALEQQRRKAEDAVHRRPQLVAHHGEEITLGLLGTDSSVAFGLQGAAIRQHRARHGPEDQRYVGKRDNRKQADRCGEQQPDAVDLGEVTSIGLVRERRETRCDQGAVDGAETLDECVNGRWRHASRRSGGSEVDQRANMFFEPDVRRAAFRVGLPDIHQVPGHHAAFEPERGDLRHGSRVEERRDLVTVRLAALPRLHAVAVRCPDRPEDHGEIAHGCHQMFARVGLRLAGGSALQLELPEGDLELVRRADQLSENRAVAGVGLARLQMQEAGGQGDDEADQHRDGGGPVAMRQKATRQNERHWQCPTAAWATAIAAQE